MKVQFTLRDLFWLALVVAILMAWWGDTPTKKTPRYVVHYSDGDTEQADD